MARKKSDAGSTPVELVARRVLSPIKVDGERVDVGDDVDLDAVTAKELEALGCVGPVPLEDTEDTSGAAPQA